MPEPERLASTVSIEFDTTELRQLATDLGSAGARASGAVRATTQRAAFNIKGQLQREGSGVRHAPNFPASITYETRESSSGIEAEIGPEKGKQVGGGKYRTPGNLANILYFGTSKSGPRLPDPKGALEAEASTYAKYLAEAVADEVLP